MERMGPFLTWYDEDQTAHHRSLLLVDELPSLIEPNVVDLPAINTAESELDQRRPSYDSAAQQSKQELLWLWEKCVRYPFKRLCRAMASRPGKYRLVEAEALQSAGLSSTDLESLLQKLDLYASGTEAERLVSALLFCNHAYFAVGRTLSLVLPRLKALHGPGQPATVIFSGTATLSPEVTRNPNIHMLPDLMEESYHRLTIMVQRGDEFNISRTAMRRAGNLQAMTAWLEALLAELTQRHEKILLVTYKPLAELLWNALGQFHSQLIPYIDPDGNPTGHLPYFGGVQGSNAYLAATAVVCAGLNRFDPQDYLARAQAVDFRNEIPQEFQQIASSGQRVRLDQIPSVMDAQDITLARDVVQLVFRSALRLHGGTQPIEL